MPVFDRGRGSYHGCDDEGAVAEVGVAKAWLVLQKGNQRLSLRHEELEIFVSVRGCGVRG